MTISITLHFCKPFNPDSRFLYMQSSVPFMDRMERGLKTEGFVESFESAVWGEKGELVCLQRQQRLVTGREAPSRYETGGGKALL